MLGDTIPSITQQHGHERMKGIRHWMPFMLLPMSLSP